MEPWAAAVPCSGPLERSPLDVEEPGQKLTTMARMSSMESWASSDDFTRMTGGSDTRQLCDEYGSCPEDSGGGSKIVQVQFLLLSIEPEDMEFARMLIDNRDLVLRFTCPPFSRREIELNACKLRRAPFESGYFDACFRCTRIVFDDIMCKYKPDLRLSIVTPKYTARGNYPFRKAYAEPQLRTPLGDWGFKHRTIAGIKLIEEVECRIVARAFVEIIVNDFNGGKHRIDSIPYKPPLDICNAVPGRRFSRLASIANFKTIGEAQGCSITYQHSRVILRREHRLLYLDVLFDIRQRMLIALAKLLNSIADGPPLELLCDDDLYEEGEDGWAEPGDRCWWTSLEEALSEGPIFEESDEACACTSGGAGDEMKGISPEVEEARRASQMRAAIKLNQINQHFFGYFNCILNITRSGAMHSRSHPIYKSIKNVLELAEASYRQLGPKLPTYQKGPLYVRDPDRFFMEHLEVFVGILGTALVMSTNSFPCVAQDLFPPQDHKVIMTNLKFAGVFRQCKLRRSLVLFVCGAIMPLIAIANYPLGQLTMMTNLLRFQTLERLIESPPKAMTTRQHLLQRYRHPANELMMMPMMQSLIDFKSLIEAYCIEGVQLYTEDDLEEVEEHLIFFQLILSVLSREIVACWIQDGLSGRYKVLQQDFPHLIAYEHDQDGDSRKSPPPPELKRNRFDAPRRLRIFIRYTEEQSTFIGPLAQMAGRLHRSGPLQEVVTEDDETAATGLEDPEIAAPGVETAAEIFSTLPGFEKLARQAGLELDKPKLEERNEVYEWEIDADCSSAKARPAPIMKARPTPEEMIELEKARRKAALDRETQQRVASRVLTHPVQSAGAAIEMLKSFPAPMLNRASVAVDRFPANVPGIADRKADVTEARMDHRTVLDTSMNRHIRPHRVTLGDECEDPRVLAKKKLSGSRTHAGDDPGTGQGYRRR